MLPNAGPALGVGDGDGVVTGLGGGGDGGIGEAARLAGAANAKINAKAINSKNLLDSALTGERGALPARARSKKYQSRPNVPVRERAAIRTLERLHESHTIATKRSCHT
jgi:hypothetical protein